MVIVGNDRMVNATPNDLPNGENQKEKAEGIRETGDDNNHPPPERPAQSNSRGSRQRRAERRVQTRAAIGPTSREKERGGSPHMPN